MQMMVNKYCELLQTIIPPLEEATQDIATASDQISPEGDIETTCSNVGTGPNQPEQLLLDYFVSALLCVCVGVCVQNVGCFHGPEHEYFTHE